nr:hypothetical protein BaRGS_022172 [Batillaria attramentaria]
MIFDPDPRGPSTTVIHINNMSEYQMHIFPEETTEELQREDDPGADRSVDVSGDGMDQENSMSAMSIVSELVGGLDSQIRTLCRNLEVLLLSRGSGSPGGEGEKETVTNVKACGDSTCLGDVDEPERFYDCFSTDGETRNEYLDCLVKHTSDLPTGSERRYRQDGPGTAHTASKPRHAPLIPAPGIPPERESTRRTEDQSRDWLEIAGGGGESTHPRHSPVRQPPAPRPPPRPPKNLPPLSQEQPTGPLERSRTLTYKSGSDGESVGVAGQYKPQCSKQETAKPGHVQSMLTLPPRAKAREAFNVIEICTESSSSSDSVVEKACGAAKDSADAEGGGSVRWGRAGGGLHKLMSRELSQVFDQSDVLRTMWNNHKTQLCDLLATREREAARAERLEQALGRARNLVTSLRRQRRDLHRYLEQKEEEWASVLRCHRNEAAFLRRKVLTGLEEKKNVLADPKRDGKFAAVLDSLLSLHIDREQFLALDLAKQNKIHELKLLAVRQQLALEELKERNSDLNHALSSLLQCLPGPSAAPPHQPRAPCSPHPRATTTSTTVSSGCVLGPRGPGLADMLYCDRSIFLPRHPTSPDLAAVTVFSVGGEQSPISSPVEEVFDASRQRCYADGDNFNHHGDGAVSESNMSTLAEELLRELTLYGPGNPDFTLADSN